MFRTTSAFAGLLLCLVLLHAKTASAQVVDTTITEVTGVDEEQLLPSDSATTDGEAAPPNGWTFKTSARFNGSYGHNRQVVGAVDGSTVQVGLLGHAEANLQHDRHAWENSLRLQHAQTLTPQNTSFVKSADELQLQSTYLYSWASLPWIGPYGRASMTTQVLRGFDIRANASTVVRTHRDGSTRTQSAAAQSRIKLTEPFEPIIFRENAGAFAKPYTSTWLNVRTKVGLGAEHVVVRDGFTLADDDSTSDVKLQQLRSSSQAGGAFEVMLNGAFQDNISWQASGMFFVPFYSNVADKLPEAKNVNTELSARLSFALASWLSADYVVSAKRLPVVLDEWQVQHGLVLSAVIARVFAPSIEQEP